MNLLNWFGNVAAGMIAPLLWTHERFAMPLLLVLAVLSFLGYRAAADRRLPRAAGAPDPAQGVFLGSLIEGTLDDSSNLIGNAVKYSPADRPIVVSVSPDIRGGHAVVSVADEGAGLGLYIARRLAEAMSGRLWVEGNAGGGSTFAFALPLSVTVLEHRSEPADALLTG